MVGTLQWLQVQVQEQASGNRGFESRKEKNSEILVFSIKSILMDTFLLKNLLQTRGALKNVLQHQNVRKGRFLLFESNIYCRKVDRIAI